MGRSKRVALDDAQTAAALADEAAIASLSKKLEKDSKSRKKLRKEYEQDMGEGFADLLDGLDGLSDRLSGDPVGEKRPRTRDQSAEALMDERLIQSLEKKLGKRSKGRLDKEWDGDMGEGFAAFIDEVDDITSRLDQGNSRSALSQRCNDGRDGAHQSDSQKEDDDDDDDDVDDDDDDDDDDHYNDSNSDSDSDSGSSSDDDSQNNDSGRESRSSGNVSNDSDNDNRSENEKDAKDSDHAFYTPATGEDIYGRTAVRETTSATKAYVPPHLRNKQAAAKEGGTAADSTLKGALNRLSDQNVTPILRLVKSSGLPNSTLVATFGEALRSLGKVAPDSSVYQNGGFAFILACVCAGLTWNTVTVTVAEDAWKSIMNSCNDESQESSVIASGVNGISVLNAFFQLGHLSPAFVVGVAKQIVAEKDKVDKRLTLLNFLLDVAGLKLSRDLGEDDRKIRDLVEENVKDMKAVAGKCESFAFLFFYLSF